MLDKIKNYKKLVRGHEIGLKSLTDMRSVSILAFGVIALLVTWSGVKVVQTNYDLQKQISAMQQENDVEQLQNNNLKLKNQYLTTDQYLELNARRNFNKAAAGEKLLVVPKSVALAHTIELPKTPAAKPTDDIPTEGAAPWYERNFNAWLQFLFHQKDS